MLTSDLVVGRVTKGELSLRPIKPPERQRLITAGQQAVAVFEQSIGTTQKQLRETLASLHGEARDIKRIKGLHKLLWDRCEIASAQDLDYPSLRRALFQRAALVRQQCNGVDDFSAQSVLTQVATEIGLEGEDLSLSLFGDLKENHRVLSFASVTPQQLVADYELAQQQAVLLKAVELRCTLKCKDPRVYRKIFSQLKFRRLLYRLEPAEGGSYRVVIDGPFALFRSSTKYGLQLALTLPALRSADSWEIEADIRWGKAKTPATFNAEGTCDQSSTDGFVDNPVNTLAKQFNALNTRWQAEPSEALLDLRGVGLSVPDLEFIDQDTGRVVYFELMGHWSRAAVWKRIELVQSGLPYEIIFALSSKLRVSEAALEDDLPGQLYVYKGVMSARVLAERLEQLA